MRGLQRCPTQTKHAGTDVQQPTCPTTPFFTATARMHLVEQGAHLGRVHDLLADIRLAEALEEGQDGYVQPLPRPLRVPLLVEPAVYCLQEPKHPSPLGPRLSFPACAHTPVCLLPPNRWFRKSLSQAPSVSDLGTCISRNRQTDWWAAGVAAATGGEGQVTCVSTLLWLRRPRRIAPTICVSHVSCPSKSATLALSAAPDVLAWAHNIPARQLCVHLCPRSLMLQGIHSSSRTAFGGKQWHPQAR